MKAKAKANATAAAAGPAAATAVAGGDGAKAALGTSPPAAAAPARASAASPAPAGAGAAAAAPAPTRSPAGPSPPGRDRGWWRRLGRLYYISFGAQYGLVPRVRVDASVAAESGSGGASAGGGGGLGLGTAASTGSPAVLIAFEDPSDAEYVANALWEDLVTTGAQPSGPRPNTMGVLSATPLFLEDMAAMRGAPLEVVPGDSLRKDVLLGPAQLEAVLAALVRGVSPAAAAAEAQQLLERATQAAASSSSSSDTAAAGGPAPAAGPSSSTARDAPGRAAPGSSGTAVDRQPKVAGATPGGGGDNGGVAGGAPPAAAERNPEALAAQKGLRIKLPTKFDFPGFDEPRATAAPPSPPVPLAPPTAAPAAGAPLATPGAAAAVAAAPSPQRPPSQPPPPPSPSPPSRPPPELAAEAEAAEALPQVEPSAVREPGSSLKRGHGSGREDWSESAPASGAAPPDWWSSPYEGVRGSRAPRKVVDAEATDVPAARAEQELRPAPDLMTAAAQAVGVDAGAGEDADVGAGPRPAGRGDDFAAAASGPEAARSESVTSTAAEERKVGPDAARDILKRQGPTDAAIEAALSALEAGEERTEDDLLSEYYQLFGGGGRGGADGSARETASAMVAGKRSRGSGGDGGGRSASASASGDLAAEVADVQRQLAQVLQGVVAAQARGLPPSPDATAAMQRLQRRLEDLQARLGSGTAAAAPAAAAPAAAVPAESPAAAASASRSAPTTSPPDSGRRSDGERDSTSAGGAAPPAASQASSSGSSPPAAGPAAAVAAGGSDGKAGARRAWGSWKANKRIQTAEATLLKTATSSAAAATPAASTSVPSGGPSRTATGSDGQASRARQQGGGGGAVSSKGEDGVTVLNKRVGTNRPPKVVEPPEVRQDRVKEALRVFSEMSAKGGGDDDDDPDGAEPDSDLLFPGRSMPGIPGPRRVPWWQSRFQALYLPTIGYPDGAVGFMQVNVSLNDARRDMRVLAFEDRADCTACLTLLAQWPEYAGTEPRLSMMPTATLMQQLTQLYDEELDINSGVSRPRGLAVFRRGKLPMRPGMGPGEFLQLVMYGHAAQTALAKTGYGFTD
ncbi:hypothetical protein GPECTOR_85g337 [Gonium pectorale]|uniref:Uncharacterized protein n=1 Tax=Gonium pectorale TaxID=33097 RepID=A0A150G194_GONPE|nr:hypothetical protein GPECTOR_85g337 [Gonium pectorale]|eukprot:KXZ43607.1 hypothetical protein GPECTOR_85g337 [Gonium pectorale]